MEHPCGRLEIDLDIRGHLTNGFLDLRAKSLNTRTV